MSACFKVEDNNSLESTSSTGAIQYHGIPIALAAMITGSPDIAMLDAYTKASHQYVSPAEIMKSENIGQGSPWEYILGDFQDNSGVSYYFPENNKEEILSKFANSLIEGMHATPKEFDKIFEENFWDILA